MHNEKRIKEIEGIKYEIVDVLNGLHLVDSWSLNKRGTGTGEGKLYIGANSKKGIVFFDDVNRRCVVLKEDLEFYLFQIKETMNLLSSEFRNKPNWDQLYEELAHYDETLWFDIFRPDLNHTGNYINSKSAYYRYLRSIAIPKMSTLSVMKLKAADEYIYLFRMIYEATFTQLEWAIHNDLSQETIIGKNIKTIANTRVGQKSFREKLMNQTGACPFTGIDDPKLLIASHIKPWNVSDDDEKVDINNGLLLSATYDRLFDQGLITFNSDGTVRVSNWLSEDNRIVLGLSDGMKVERLIYNKKKDKYMEYHRKNVFLK